MKSLYISGFIFTQGLCVCKQKQKFKSIYPAKEKTAFKTTHAHLASERRCGLGGRVLVLKGMIPLSNKEEYNYKKPVVSFKYNQRYYFVFFIFEKFSKIML